MALRRHAQQNARPLLAAGVFLLAAGLYLPTLDHTWLNYDDDVYITDNPEQLRGLTPEGVAWAFTSFHGANWFPLTRLSWALDLELFGLSAAGFHATSLLLHALTAVLLFLALARLTKSPGASAFVAGVFAAHPLHVESVAWAAARKDPLSALFFALALFVYARAGRGGPSPRQQATLFACLALGLLAKPIVASLPAVLLLLDLWPLERLRRGGRWHGPGLRRALVEKLPLFALVAAFAVVAFAAQRAGGAVAPIERLPLGMRAANALVSYAVYLRQGVWPSDLAIFYPHPGDTLEAGVVIAAGALLAGITVWVLARLERQPYLAVGWLWYVVTLLPVIGLLQVGSQARADRYMYLPLVGLALALAFAARDALGSGRRARRALALAGAATVAALSVATLLQLRHWRDSEALFRHALQVTERNSVAHAHLGSALLEKGRVEETLHHFRRALEVEPGFLRAANNLAWLLATLPDPALRDSGEALALAQGAAAQSGQDDPAVLDTLAAAQASAGRFARAVVSAERALALAEQRGDVELAGQLRRRLALYRAGRPYREPPSGAPASGSRRATR